VNWASRGYRRAFTARAVARAKLNSPTHQLTNSPIHQFTNSPAYSSRNAAIGSTREARQPGIQQAMSDAQPSTVTTPA
jgi:hypothetical protein